MDKSKEKSYWEMSNTERLKELGQLFYKTEAILRSFSEKDYNRINTGAVYCLPNCIKWGIQCIGELKGMLNDE